jgi:hypothetical protein
MSDDTIYHASIYPGGSEQQFNDLKTSVRDLLEELTTLTQGESCDHSVGICWCETFRRMEDARQLLKELQ